MTTESDGGKDGVEMTEPLTANAVTPYTETSAAGMPSSDRTENYSESFDDHPPTRDEEDIESYSSDDESTDENESEEELSLSEFLYSINSFHAIVRPVSITMLLAALAAIFVNDEETTEMGAEQLASAYNVWDIDSTASTGKNLVASIGNALVMVTFIGTMTFGIVLLYKYRCMKFLIGYMVFSSASLLGLLGDYMASVAIEIYRIPIDKISYTLIMYNFAIVGVTAIFYQKGIPQSITQTYLVFTSVILAWHLAHFDDWTAWSLLVMLAFYDLCAVLSPCGPLKALVNLMSEKDSPDMPGLLYEAQLPPSTSRAGPPTSRHPSSSGRESSTSCQDNNTHVATSEVPTPNEEDSSSDDDSPANSQSRPLTPASATNANRSKPTISPLTGALRVRIPLALAKTYRLPIVSGYDAIPSNRKKRRRNRERVSSAINESPLLADTSPQEFYDNTKFSIADLLCEVEVEFVSGGGRIERDGSDRKDRPIFKVYGRDNNIRRTLIVDRNGKVYEIKNNDDDDDSDDESVYEHSSSIRLGLGDFIFYSVMVAKAAMYSFTTFAACMLVILSGLGGTLILLSVYHSALPALPISIFMGVIFYLLTKVLIEPWIEVIMTAPLYV